MQLETEKEVVQMAVSELGTARVGAGIVMVDLSGGGPYWCPSRGF